MRGEYSSEHLNEKILVNDVAKELSKQPGKKRDTESIAKLKETDDKKESRNRDLFSMNPTYEGNPKEELKETRENIQSIQDEFIEEDEVMKKLSEEQKVWEVWLNSEVEEVRRNARKELIRIQELKEKRMAKLIKPGSEEYRVIQLYLKDEKRLKDLNRSIRKDSGGSVLKHRKKIKLEKEKQENYFLNNSKKYNIITKEG